jgi:L-alanine-DL-glutamate epimerase-like enolase superfamily enzyme
VHLVSLTAVPFPIPLKEPFTISRASVDSTRAALVRARARALRGEAAGGEGEVGEVEGFGEAALPLGSAETVADLTAAVGEAARVLEGRELGDLGGLDEIAAALDACGDARLDALPPARAGVHAALADAWARLAGVPLYAALGAEGAVALTTDITLPIAEPAHLARLAVEYWERGFRAFKIKVGARLADDQDTVARLARATPGAALRFDANEGFGAEDALALLRFTAEAGLAVECFEQPCARDDLAGLRRVREEGGVPVVADESVRDERDLDRLVAARAVDGINLKLVKMGGIDRCLRLGRLAREHGLSLMVGAMIESRLGLTAMAHAVAALGGVEWVDLDTAFLLAADPYEGGMRADGPRLELPASPGLGISLR